MPRHSYAVLMLLVFSTLLGFGQPPPSADGYVTNTQPAANFGNSTFLPVQAGTTSYIRLNLEALPPNAIIAKATLRLYVSAVAAPGSFDVFQVDGGWSEKGLKFNNAPVLGASATGGHSIQVNVGSVNQFFLIDITPLAQAWLNGTAPNRGIALALTSLSGSFSFDSKESAGTGHQPELDVVVASVPSDTSSEAMTSESSSASVKLQLRQGVSDPYIDNGTALQAGANFNIDGTGTAANFNVISQYLLAGSPVLGGNGTSSFFLGLGAGQGNTGSQNTFFGIFAGYANSSGSYNTFMGTSAGFSNTNGSNNSFVGTNSGSSNTGGSYNTFLGTGSGRSNSTGSYLTFLRMRAGFSNMTGDYNSFMGTYSGYSNTTGAYLTFLGMQAGYSNTTGSNNSFVGTNSGFSNTTGAYNSFLGTGSGRSSTTGSYLTFLGMRSGFSNTTGSSNSFVGTYSGFNNTTGSSNTFIGFNAGLNADPAASNNIYITSLGASNDSGTIRIGDPSTQTSAYVAGINGSSTNSGVPVFVDSSGKLGTGGGSVNFTQVTGTLASPQFTGNYTNAITLSNTTNMFNGSFVGNGSGLTGVASGLSWPIMTKSADYLVQISDFSTPSTYGSYLILTGSVAHTFTLPNPAPPNGSCVAIGNFAAAPIGSGTNVFLTISGNGLQIEGTSTNGMSTQPRRNSYLYCSDGAGYWRLDRQLASPSQVGPVLYTVDTGVQDTLKTTFVAGLDFGLNTGTTIFILPIHPNATTAPTLDVNGLGAKRIVRFGNQPVVAGDLSTTALAVLIYDGQFWQLVNPQTVAGTVTAVTATAPLVSTGGTTPNISCPTCVTTAALTGTTGSIGGSVLTAGPAPRVPLQ